MDKQTDFSIVCQVLEITKLQHCLCGGVAGNLLRVPIFHYHSCRHENVEPWPYAHKNIHHANEATKVPLHQGKTIPWNIREYLQRKSSVNEPYAHDNIHKATEATKVATQQVSVYQTHIVIYIRGHENVKDWPYTLNSVQIAIKATQFALPHIYMYMCVYIHMYTDICTSA